jgi:hypothetical protein
MGSMRGFRLLVATAVCAVAACAAGCGGGGGSSATPASSSPDTPSTATLAPADASAWIEVDLDQSSEQWSGLQAFAGRIPGGEKLFDDVFSNIGGTSSSLSFEDDVRPALGKTLVVVLPKGATDPVLLVQPADDAKLEKLLAGDKQPEVTGEVDDWTAVARSQPALDALKASLEKGTLAGSDAFAGAMRDVPNRALVRGYVAGSALAQLGTGSSASGSSLSQALSAATALGQSTPLGSSSMSQSLGSLGASDTLPVDVKDLLESLGFAVTASDDAIRIIGSVATGSKTPAVPSYEPTLLAKVPGDALVALSFHGSDTVTMELRDTLGSEAFKGLQEQLGVSVDDLAATLDGEGVVYVRAGTPLPEITLALRPSDPTKAKQTLDALVAKVRSQLSSSSPLPGVELTTVSAGDVLLVSTATAAPSAWAGTAATLTSTQRFKDAAASVHLGDTTSGFAYVDLRGLTPLLKTALGALGGSTTDKESQQLFDVLGALDSVAVNTTSDGERMHVEAVVKAA